MKNFEIDIIEALIPLRNKADKESRLDEFWQDYFNVFLQVSEYGICLRGKSDDKKPNVKMLNLRTPMAVEL